MGFLPPIQFPAAARPGPIIQRGVQPRLEKPLAGLRHGDGGRMQHGRNGLHRLLLLGQQQRMRPAYGTGRGVALVDEGLEQRLLVATQLHDRLLGHGSLLSAGSVPKNMDKRNRCNRLLRMTKELASQQAARNRSILRAALCDNKHREVFVMAGKKYLAALVPITTWLPMGVTLTMAEGGIGRKLQRLKAWLLEKARC
jgi:hypothetical protein